ncbi:hypothetical protein K435DRAFT_724365 [Dendrothele bispora CBS 962.96]|uniref:Uncharacterized protein n=1 Tax=Dendrothele bispora (strain CBS 962.96) TaxID=1314807 RepID=A0A4S8LYF0_DENBC|nr:hypothetical protein K435DRAFT_724365 [Dendrothele bispora CBS 962.96]
MLSFALKIVWFSLSLSGLLSCWVVLAAFSKVYESRWAPLLYCLACTLLQGVFCIGLAWQMNPFHMPPAFCIAQTLIIGFASFSLTGICGTLSFAASLFYWKPDDGVQHALRRILTWRNVYIIPLCAFPISCIAAQTTVILTLDAVHPTDGLHCDATNPSWARFLGYAGSPFIIAIPLFCFSGASIIHVLRKRRTAIQRPNPWDPTLGPFTTLRPRRTHYKDFRKYTSTPPIPRVLPSPSPSTQYVSAPGRAPINPGLSSPIFSARQFHLPFSPPPPEETESAAQQHSSHSPSLQDTDSIAISSLFPTFAPPSDTDILDDPSDPGPADFMNYLHFHDRWKEPSTSYRSRHDELEEEEHDDVSTIRWNHPLPEDDDHDGGNEWSSEYTEHESKHIFARDRHRRFDSTGRPQIDSFHNTPSPLPLSNGPPSRHDPSPLPCSLSHLWKMIIFQLSFLLVLLLACISALIDVIAQRDSPSPFGTHHIALLLTVWIPVILIGHIPVVRKNLRFW